MEEKDCGDRRTFNFRKILSKYLLDLFLFVCHCLLGCTPYVTLLDQQSSKEWHLGLIEFLTQKCIKIILLLTKYLLLNNDLDGFSLLTRCLLAPSPTTVIPSFDTQQELLDAASRPIPNIKIPTCLLRNHLQDSLHLPSSKTLRNYI